MKDVVVLIPAYNPNQKLIELIIDLNKEINTKIIVVNDGSNKKYNKIFEKIQKIDNCIVLEYSTNKGKGYALKYGINYYLENLTNDYLGIVTVDCDYQHVPEDILNLIIRLKGNQDSLILGVRDFNQKNIPLLNKFGNKLTSVIFKLLYGVKIIDTQTGLRAIPNRYLNLCLEAKGERFEYEMNMLIKFTKEKINIIEEKINTVYYSKNKSKFNKIIDSIRIYKVLFTEYIKYGLTSFIASIFDLIIFSSFLAIFTTLNDDLRIILATCIARVISSFINFNLTKYLVFKSQEKSQKILGKFYLHCFCNMIASATFLLILNDLFPNFPEVIFKMIIDILIYCIGFKIQKKYIFKS